MADKYNIIKSFTRSTRGFFLIKDDFWFPRAIHELFYERFKIFMSLASLEANFFKLDFIFKIIKSEHVKEVQGKAAALKKDTWKS